MSLTGIPTLTALAAVFSMITFMPTGGTYSGECICHRWTQKQGNCRIRMTCVFPGVGITSGNIADYLALPAVVACGGTWMVRHVSLSPV